MRKVLVAALLAGSFATPALAQEAASFTGPRIEGLVGYDILKSGESDDDGVDTSSNNGDESIEGVSYGVGVGYDFDLGNVVAGVEAEYADSSGEQEADETLDGINFSSSVETGRDIYVGARLGFRAAPSTLVYVKGGYTNTSIEANYETAGDRFEFDTNVDGWRLGAGIEQLFGPNLYGKLEYRYSNYNNLDFSDNFDLDNFEAEDFDTDINLDRHQIMAGIGFRF
ncbi:porin family protein [Sphingomonas parva]|uniref:Porin family protein n=1 Tax=Sphingomonas parva TaxID=2555898 RepID=A0A4Y8ZXQ2_9SPHN|nr:outer membrane beta-barrel protein [Sphingomonas parva]TFI60025.1 porin family protein [Sphingomonas parva]